MAITTVTASRSRTHSLAPKMSESRSELTSRNDDDNSHEGTPSIPVEIVSNEEMALLEAALAAAVATSRSSVSCSSSSPIHSASCSPQKIVKSKSVHSITALSKRGLSAAQPDIEDLCEITSTQKRMKLSESLLRLFRRGRCLSVTDITRTEWCEKQMDFTLRYGPQKVTKPMEAGTARHRMLEEEVVKKVRVQVKSVEDRWALKLLNFTSGVNQLLFEGLTRELPVMSMIEGVWMIGVIDEIRMLDRENGKIPMLVDTKTRSSDTIPTEPQQRNGKLQLMCYKYLWDSIVPDGFSSRQFFDFFSLNPYCTLSNEITEGFASLGFTPKTLDDVVRCYINSCSMLPRAHNQLLLRYESQKDQSVIVEDEFAYDHDWLRSQLDSSLQVWLGQREAERTPQEERWKCRRCQFASTCHENTNLDTTSKPN